MEALRPTLPMPLKVAAHCSHPDNRSSGSKKFPQDFFIR
jgi:hypothetical protein